MASTANEETPVMKQEGVKQETIDYNVSEEYKTRFIEAPHRKSKKATFPPGCQVLVQEEEDDVVLCLATIQQVGALDIGDEEITDQRYKVKAVPPHTCPREIVWEKDLRFAAKTPVWWDRCDGRGSTKPGFVVTQLGHKSSRSVSGENLYSIQLFDLDNTIVGDIPQSKLKYNFNPQSPKNVVNTATTNTIIRSPLSSPTGQEVTAELSQRATAPSSDKAPQQKQKSKKQKSKKSKAKRNDKKSSRNPDDNGHNDTALQQHVQFSVECQSSAAPKKRAPNVAVAASESRSSKKQPTPQKKSQQMSSFFIKQRKTTAATFTPAAANTINNTETTHRNHTENEVGGTSSEQRKNASSQGSAGSQRTTSMSQMSRQSATPASTADNAINTVATNRNCTKNAAASSDQRKRASSQGSAGSQRTTTFTSQMARQSATEASAAPPAPPASATNRSNMNRIQNTSAGGTATQNATLMSKKIPRKSTAPSIASIIHRAVASNRRQSANASVPKEQVSQRAAAAASAARATKLAILQQHQQQRRQNLPPGYKLNENPSPFSAIHYSPHHDIEQALETVRRHIEDHGSPTEWGVWGNCHRNPYKPFGGVGPFLHNPCLHWHIQGQCRPDCPRRKNHDVTLTQKQAQEIERALFPAMTTGRQDSPILSLDALVTLIENENKEGDPGITGTSAAAELAHPADRGHTANHNTNNPETIIDMINAPVGPDVEAQQQATTQRKRKRSKGIEIPVLLPVYFGEDFFRSILDSAVPHDFTERLEDEYDCSWELEASMDHDNQKRLKLVLEGGDFDKLFSCRYELERILCEKLDDNHLVAKFLMDLEKLNKLRNPEAGNQPVLQVRRPGAERHDDVCWMTEIQITAEYQRSISSDSPKTLKLQAAQNAHQRLRYRYDNLNLVLHDRQRPGANINGGIISARYYRHPDVPSHLIIWGEDRWNVEHCRNDFFSVVALDEGEEDLF